MVEDGEGSSRGKLAVAVSYLDLNAKTSRVRKQRVIAVDALDSCPRAPEGIELYHTIPACVGRAVD